MEPAPKIQPTHGEKTSAERRQAAVAIILDRPNPSSDFSFLMIERAVRTGDPWSGHMAFPGGRAEATDPNLQATAERETREEVGIELRACAHFRTALGAGWTTLGALEVHAFVYELHTPTPPPLTLATQEVETALWVPTAPLRSGAADHRFTPAGLEPPRQFDAFRFAGRTIWGLSYKLVRALLDEEVLKLGKTPPRRL